jgi:hypothetical protein
MQSGMRHTDFAAPELMIPGARPTLSAPMQTDLTLETGIQTTNMESMLGVCPALLTCVSPHRSAVNRDSARRLVSGCGTVALPIHQRPIPTGAGTSLHISARRSLPFWSPKKRHMIVFRGFKFFAPVQFSSGVPTGMVLKYISSEYEETQEIADSRTRLVR